MNPTDPSYPVDPIAEPVIQIKVSTLRNLAMFGIVARFSPVVDLPDGVWHM